jgi:intracellular sulfur oxidation DsrE/DsrF family protein
VVYHIATADQRQQQIALLNLANHLDELREQGRRGQIKVLLEGDGVELFVLALESPRIQQQILSLHRKGVRFVMAQGSLKRKGLELQHDLLSHVVDQVVDNGVLELVRLQQQGYAYIPYIER